MIPGIFDVTMRTEVKREDARSFVGTEERERTRPCVESSLAYGAGIHLSRQGHLVLELDVICSALKFLET